MIRGGEIACDQIQALAARPRPQFAERKAIIPAQHTLSRTHKQSRRLERVLRGKIIEVGVETRGWTTRTVEFALQLFADGAKIELHSLALKERHCQIDVARVAVEAQRVNWDGLWQEHEFGHERPKSLIPIESQERKPELSPCRYGKNATRP